MTVATQVLGQAQGPGVQIRRAQPYEAGPLAILGLRSLAEFEADFSESEWQAMRAEWEDVGRRLAEAQVLVAHLDGELVGTVTLDPKSDASGHAPWPRRCAVIRVLAVDPAFRRQGIGRALTEESRRRAMQLGLEHLVATTTPFMVAARGVLEDCGFVRAAQLDHGWASGGVARVERGASVPLLAYVREA